MGSHAGYVYVYVCGMQAGKKGRRGGVPTGVAELEHVDERRVVAAARAVRVPLRQAEHLAGAIRATRVGGVRVRVPFVAHPAGVGDAPRVLGWRGGMRWRWIVWW